MTPPILSATATLSFPRGLLLLNAHCPAFNEERALPLVLKDLPKVGRVIVVNNASRDATAAVAFAHGATVVHEPVRGYGAACLQGLAAIRELIDDGEPPPRVVVFLDADYSDHPELLPELVKPIFSGIADFVLGSRLQGQREPGSEIVAGYSALCDFRVLLHCDAGHGTE